MHPLLLYFFAVLFSPSALSLADASERIHGFSIDLIDRDSPLSPFYITAEDKSFEPSLHATKYTYLMKLRVGTPPVDTFAIPDTGSDLIWFNGDGCRGSVCEKQKVPFIIKPPTPPQEACDERLCKEVPGYQHPECPCLYNITYMDSFTTRGELTRDNFLFPITGHDGDERGYNISFGLSEYSNGPLEKRSAGIVGLGRGNLSLISQLCDTAGISFKFSYCLPQNSNSTGMLTLGNHVKISVNNYTPLLPDSHHYKVHLVHIFVGKHNILVRKNITIDSGSTFTSLDPDVFHRFRKSLKQKFHPDPGVAPYHDCFEHEINGKKLSIPTVSFRFNGTNGSTDVTKVELEQKNFFDIVHINETYDWLCLTVIEGKENILGSSAQVGFQVAFDIKENKASFDPNGCSKQNVESLHNAE